MMKKVIYLVLIFLVSGTYSYGQRNFAQEADKSFELEQYYDAIPLYQKAYKKVKGNRVEQARILFQIGVCYRMTNNHKRAETTFRRVISAKYPEPLLYLYYADALKAQENYAEALVQYEEYQKLATNDPLGQKGVESCRLAVQWKENPTRYVLDNNRKINSRANDFAPVYADRRYRSLVFTSSREEAKGKGYDAWTGEAFTDLFIISMDRKGNWGNATPLDDTGELNSPANEGAACFNDRMSTLYFTRCDTDKKKRMGCQIYISTKKGRGWGNIELIPITSDSLTVGHPAVTSDELTMYFASNMPGGLGGRDIWMVQRPRKNRPFGEPVNLGPTINTPGNELYPTLRNDSTLYFSSDFHLGMGGLDIFKTELRNGEWTTPENLMYPINSAGDDFHIVFNMDAEMLKEENAQEMGFFTSNRPGGRGGDDIWFFKLPPILFTLSGIIYNDSTKLPINKAVVELTGSDGTIYIDTTDAKGFYKFKETQILQNTSYNLAISKSGFYGETGRETTVGLNQSTDLVRDFYLVPIPVEPILLPDILYELGRWELLPASKIALEKLVETMNKNPNIVIELQSHTDIRPIPITNDTLSQRRAESVVKYLIDRGIAPDRLVAKGYADRVPRVLEDNRVSEYRGKTFTFKKGTVLTKQYIESLSSRDEQEAAHSLNRRTTFQILRDDYIPSKDTNIEVPKIQIIQDTKIDQEIDNQEKE
jgi:peptidoglycan-associated lipoprotein